MGDIRETQLVTETLHQSNADARVTQLPLEALNSAVAYLFGTQLVVEVLCDVDYFSVISYDSIGEAVFGSVIIR